MKYEFVLTVSQSKRIIAKAVAKHPLIEGVLKKGTLIICRGTTNTYVAEEILGEKLEPFAYSIGVTMPRNPSPPVKSATKRDDIIIRNGKMETNGESIAAAFATLSTGDVVIKGGNALNYEKQVAGCLVGHPTGGTVGAFWGLLYGRKARLIIPIGLEKEISGDIAKISTMNMDNDSGNSLAPLLGEIVTEIEAINILTGASSYQTAAGGIRGAEGAVRLVSYGQSSEIESLKNLLSSIENEIPY